MIVATFAGFLILQAITIVVKVYFGRRPCRDLMKALYPNPHLRPDWPIHDDRITTARIWSFLLLALPGIPVFGWHRWLVSRQDERRQAGVEIAAIAVLALSAPTVYWISIGSLDHMGWWLWGMLWMQSAASILSTYLRLEQRVWKETPTLKIHIQSGKRAIVYSVSIYF
jgi:hypothetical protein